MSFQLSRLRRHAKRLVKSQHLPQLAISKRGTHVIVDSRTSISPIQRDLTRCRPNSKSVPSVPASILLIDAVDDFNRSTQGASSSKSTSSKAAASSSKTANGSSSSNGAAKNDDSDDIASDGSGLPVDLLTSFHFSGDMSYKHQFANVYFMRLAKLKPIVQANAEKLWSDVAGAFQVALLGLNAAHQRA